MPSNGQPSKKRKTKRYGRQAHEPREFDAEERGGKAVGRATSIRGRRALGDICAANHQASAYREAAATATGLRRRQDHRLTRFANDPYSGKSVLLAEAARLRSGGQCHRTCPPTQTGTRLGGRSASPDATGTGYRAGYRRWSAATTSEFARCARAAGRGAGELGGAKSDFWIHRATWPDKP
ncbi:hypothetical protein [Polynucleobacter sp. TUM22923]|uniref:hypothetical protein n=1 Tax=Polynucleobacter sp. TUM22923 TaxID=3022126 RepID=UPI002572F731|nr:hypothetical protein [Polynucleobacter sp. TUM22923]